MGIMDVADVDRDSLPWRTATMSSAGACVEVAPCRGMVAVRHSHHPEGAIVFYTGREWRAFIHGAKNGEFDDLANDCPEWD